MDVIEGRGPAPSFVKWLVLGLPDTSMYAAMRRGGLQYLGRGEDRELLTQTFNALQLNTRATGNWGKKAPNLPFWPQPQPLETSGTQTKKPKLADLHRGFMSGGK